MRDQRKCPFELNASAQFLCSEIEWVNRKHGYCQRGFWSCERAPDCLQHSTRLFKTPATCNASTASSLVFWGNTQVYPNSLTGKSFKSKDAPSSRSALAHRLNGRVDYLMPVHSPTLDSPIPQTAVTLSFENFPLVTSRIILAITLSLILNLHQIVNNKLLTTWVRGKPIKTTFACSLTRIKILCSLMNLHRNFRIGREMWKLDMKLPKVLW